MAGKSTENLMREAMDKEGAYHFTQTKEGLSYRVPVQRHARASPSTGYVGYDVVTHKADGTVERKKGI